MVAVVNKGRGSRGNRRKRGEPREPVAPARRVPPLPPKPIGMTEKEWLADQLAQAVRNTAAMQKKEEPE